MSRRHRSMGAQSLRRGTVLVLVLSVLFIVVAIALGGMALSRTEAHAVELRQDWHHAGTLAQSAVDHALVTIAADRWWRETYGGYESVFCPEIDLNGGFISWRLDDLMDNDLEDNDSDPLRIYGRARVGNAARAYSTVVWPEGDALDVLRTAVHADGRLDVLGVLDVRGGPASAGVDLQISGQILGDAEAPAISPPGVVSGTANAPVPAKQMPSAAVWSIYSSLATDVPYADLGGELRRIVLSPLSNPPRPDKLNPDGLYRISVPAASTLRIRECRIEGTLLIELKADARLELGPSLLWHAVRPDYPALIVYTGSDSNTQVALDCSGALDEAALGVNLNPAHTPYFGASDADLADVYPTLLQGVFHVIRNVAAPLARTTITGPRRIFGAFIADGEIRVEGTTVVVADPGLLSNPPLGYSTLAVDANLLTNGDMESGLAGWTPVGALTSLQLNSGHRGQSVQVKDRQTAANGIRQDVTGAVSSGTSYVADLWLKLNDAIEDVEVSLEIDSTGEGVQRFSTTIGEVQKSWTRVQAILTPTWTGDLHAAGFVVNTTTTNQDFRIDDASLQTQTPGPPAPRLAPVPGTWRAEAAN